MRRQMEPVLPPGQMWHPKCHQKQEEILPCSAWPDAEVNQQYSLPGCYTDFRHHLGDTSTSPTRQAGPWVLGRSLKISSSLVKLKGSCHTSPGICKLCLGPKQHQADQLPRVCRPKGSMVDTTEMLQDIQCQQHAGNAGLTISPTQVQESKTGELL